MKSLRYKFLLSISLFISFTVMPSKAAFHINEIMPANAWGFMDASYNFGGWVEIYNDAYVAQSLYGYYLSLYGDSLKQFRITDLTATVPARGYWVIYFDHHDMASLQVDDKMDCEGGTVYLTNRMGDLVESVSYPEQITNTSWARLTDGTGEWGVCSAPTPGSTNNRAPFAANRLQAPLFSMDGGVFTSAVTVNITSPDGLPIYYTLDGSEPTLNSSRWSGEMVVSQSAVIRAQVIADGFIPSPLVSRSYIISDHEVTLPVVCIAINPRFLINDTVGIYVKGTNGIVGNGQSTPCNFNQDWDRPANIEYYVGGKLVLDQLCDIAIGGGWTRAYSTIKSLKLGAEKKYEGLNSFDYDFFAQKPGQRYKGIYLRNGGNDYNGSLMKDAFQHCLAGSALDMDYQAYQPVVHYINGKYYGITNLRERSNVQYIYSNYGYDKEEIDMVEKIAPSISPYFEVKTGTIDAMNDLVTLSARAADATVYAQIEKRMDVDQFLAYLVPEIFSGNWDWPENNVKFFRLRNGGRFRWIMYDLENGWSSSYNCFTDASNGFTGANNSGTAAQYSHTAVLFKNLINNSTFKNRFIDYMSLCMGSLYTSDRITYFVDSIASLIRPEMSYEQSLLGLCYSFENYVSGFKSAMTNRPYTVMEQMKSFFSLTGDIVSLSLSKNRSDGTILVNDIPVPLGGTRGYTFTGRNLTLKAQAPAGYHFKQWSYLSGNSETIFSAGSNWKYYDKGSLDNTSWSSSSYDDTSWSQGAAPLGYGKNTIVTTVSYGSDSRAKYPTTYFRTTLNLASLSSSDEFTVTLSIDDGAIVYLNDREVYRYLLANGTITYDTYATTYSTGNPAVTTFTIPASYFKKGANSIAVEVHQNSGSSSDIYLDMEISRKGSSTTLAHQEPQWTIAVTAPVEVEAEFEEDTPAAGAATLPPVRINEVSASNDIYVNDYFKRSDWIELYNTTGSPISIAGLYISNDPLNLQLCRLPAAPVEQTVIAPYGYRILWADKLQDKTQLHLPFKLPAEGGRLYLSSYAGDGATLLWSDTLTYVWHGESHTFGRYPDGCDSLYIFNRVTFMAANRFSPINESATALAKAYGDSITRADSIAAEIHHPAMEPDVVSVTYYNMAGQAMGEKAPIKSGVYIRCERLSNGAVRNVKVIKR